MTRAPLRHRLCHFSAARRSPYDPATLSLTPNGSSSSSSSDGSSASSSGGAGGGSGSSSSSVLEARFKQRFILRIQQIAGVQFLQPFVLGGALILTFSRLMTYIYVVPHR